MDPALTVSDVDSALLDSALVQIGAQTGDVISHAALPAGISVSVEPAGPLAQPGVILVTLTGEASAADYAEALRALRFASTSEYPSEVPREIQFAVQDRTSASAVAASTLTVEAVNDAPVAHGPTQIQATEDTPLVLPEAVLLADVTDADLDALSVTATANVSGGSIETRPDGTVVFVPDADYAGAGGFDYTVSDGRGGEVVARAEVDVAAVDDAPTLDLSAAAADADYAFTYTEDDPATAVVGSDILLGDVDTAELVSARVTLVNGEPGDRLSVGTLPAAISASVVPNGALTEPGTITVYLTGAEIPSVYGFALSAVGFSSDSQSPSETPRVIEVTVSDGTSDSDVARTAVAVVSVNDAPVANPDDTPPLLTTPEDTPIEFSPVANDADADGDPLFVTAIGTVPVVAGGGVSIPEGRVTLLADGVTLRFEPRANLFGEVRFDYTVSDGRADASATAAIRVVSVNDLPVLGPDAPVAMDEDTTAGFDPTANDTDVEGEPVRVATLGGRAASPGTSVAIPEGTVRLGIDGRTITFTPLANLNGPVSVSYGVSDGVGVPVDGVLVFDVAPVNDPISIVAQPPAVTIADGANVSLPMSPFILDPDGDPVIYTATGLPAGLWIERDSGVIRGTLASDASEQSPYAVTVTGDDRAGSTLSIEFGLTAVNTVPTAAAPRNVAVNDGDIVAFPGADLFSDADGDVLAFTGEGLPVWLDLDARTGEVSGVVPFDASQDAPVRFTLTATDHAGAAATAEITFVPSNLAPAIVRTFPTIYSDEGRAVSLDLSGAAVDGGRDGDALLWTVSGLPDGIVFDPATRLISGEPAPGTRSAEPYTILVAVDDGQGGAAQTSFVLYVGDMTRPVELFDFDALPDTSVTRPEVLPASERTLGFGARAVSRTGGTAAADAETFIVGTVVSAVDALDDIDGIAFETDGFEPRIRATLRGDDMPGGGAAFGEALPVARPIDYAVGEDGTVSSSLDADERITVIEVPEMFAETVAPATVPAENAVRVAARVAPGKVFVDVRDPRVAGEPVRPVTFAVRDAFGVVSEKIIRNGLAVFGVSPETVDLSLTVAAELADGVLVVRDVDIDATTGAVKPAEPVEGREPLPRYPELL